MQYNETLKGYIADVPKLIFKRCDGKKFALDKLTAATVTPNVEFTDVRAGWSLFPVAQLPGQSTFDMQITSGQFDVEIFSMTNNTKYTENADYAMATNERHEVSAAHQVTLLQKPIQGSVYIRGLEEASEEPVATGTFKVDYTTGTITFSEADSLGTLEVIYDYTKTVQQAIIDNKSSAIGSAVLIWPVYDSGDTCADSAIVGYYVVEVFRARITSLPGMDSSYKTAGTLTVASRNSNVTKNILS